MDCISFYCVWHFHHSVGFTAVGQGNYLRTQTLLWLKLPPESSSFDLSPLQAKQLLLQLSRGNKSILASVDNWSQQAIIRNVCPDFTCNSSEIDLGQADFRDYVEMIISTGFTFGPQCIISSGKCIISYTKYPKYLNFLLLPFNLFLWPFLFTFAPFGFSCLLLVHLYSEFAPLQILWWTDNQGIPCHPSTGSCHTGKVHTFWLKLRSGVIQDLRKSSLNSFYKATVAWATWVKGGLQMKNALWLQKLMQQRNQINSGWTQTLVECRRRGGENLAVVSV